MIKVSHYFLKELHAAFLLKIVEFSELGMAEKKFIIHVENKIIHCEIAEPTAKINGNLLLLSSEESGD